MSIIALDHEKSEIHVDYDEKNVTGGLGTRMFSRQFSYMFSHLENTGHKKCCQTLASIEVMPESVGRKLFLFRFFVFFLFLFCPNVDPV